MKTKKKKKGWIILLIAVAAIVAVFLLLSSLGSQISYSVSGMPLSRMTLRSTVSSSGKVESMTSKNVYTKLEYPVSIVNVEVGDVVKEGDILCQLDSKDLEDTIRQTSLQLEQTRKTAGQSVASAQKSYQDAKNTLESGLNSNLLSAQSQVEATKLALDKAKQDLKDAQDQLDENTNSALISAQSSVDTAKYNLDQAQTAYDTAKTKLDEGKNSSIMAAEAAVESAEQNYKAAQNAYSGTDPLQMSANGTTVLDNYYYSKNNYNDAKEKLRIAKEDAQKELEDLQKRVEQAQLSYQTAQDALRSTQSNTNSSIGALQISVDNAQLSYDNALSALKAAEVAVAQGIDSSKLQLDSAQISSDTSVQEAQLAVYNQRLVDCTLKAPVSGTVTAVYAKEGATAATNGGLLFIIEDVDQLKVTSSIKEYDIGQIREGMDVEITSNATGDALFQGKVTKIAPAADKSATDTQFHIEVTVDANSSDTESIGLLVGMSTRLSIITETRENIFGVPYDMVGYMADGTYAVFTAEPSGKNDNMYTVKAIPVEVGLESDLYVEITSDQLTEGMTLISTVTAGNITGGVEMLAEGLPVSMN